MEALQASYLDQGITFDIGGEERAMPLDILPRVIEMETWTTIEKGLQQRVRALEMLLADVYDAGNSSFARRRAPPPGDQPPARTSTGRPPAIRRRQRRARARVAGIDLIRDENGEFAGARGQRAGAPPA